MGFGDYLVQKGLIKKEQHGMALRIQNKKRLLGVIAEEEGYMTAEDVSAVMEESEGKPDIQFGELAVSRGYLTSNQLRYLLDIRTRRKVRIGDILVQKGFISGEILLHEVMNYEAKRKKLNRILICEPMHTVAMLLQRMLAKYGYSVTTVKTGAEAIKAALELKPNILMTSNVLEDMDGYSLCSRVLNNPAAVGVHSILLSSDADKDNIDRAFESGINHFIKKPVQEYELVNVILQLEREEAEKRAEKILIVDDSAGARSAIYKELSRAWGNIHMAVNGRDAVTKALQLRPDIITMDVEMPVMDGFQACRELKEHPDTESIPVIMISAHSSMELRARGFDSGAVEYFTKPFQDGTLSSFLRMLMEAKKISRKEKVLVADDSQVTRHILKYYFTKNGYNVYTADNGEEALGLMEKVVPDILVTDCYMPRLDGFDLAKKVREKARLRHIPIVMITASASKTDILKGLAAGANDYLAKPFDEAELLARIDSLLKTKSLFDQLERDKAELKKVNEEKNRFLSMAAHDLRNPLGAISGYASYLVSHVSDEETRVRFLKIIAEAAGGMMKLVDDLLNISKIENGVVALETATGDLAEVVATRVALANILAREKDITIHFSRDKSYVLPFDKHKVEQVIDNFISNAIKFSPPGKNVYVSLNYDAVNVRVAVRDEGPGIPEKEHNKVFVPFAKISVRPTGNETSTGLGLAIAARIVNAHGGTTGFESEPGRGSVFFFTLPKETGE